MADRIRISITKMKYGWSKYGGAMHGLVKEESKGTFFCQACGREQVNDLGRYMLPLHDGLREFALICGECKRRSLETGVSLFASLSVLVREKKGLWQD